MSMLYDTFGDGTTALGGQNPIEDVVEIMTQEEFTLGRTWFRVVKMPPMEAWLLMNSVIRPELGRVAAAEVAETFSGGGKEADAFISMLAHGVLGFDPVVVEHLCAKMFKYVHFKHDTMSEPHALVSNESDAFQHIEPMDIYEILARCLAVNFTRSLQQSFSKLMGLTSRLRPSTLETPPESLLDS